MTVSINPANLTTTWHSDFTWNEGKETSRLTHKGINQAIHEINVEKSWHAFLCHDDLHVTLTSTTIDTSTNTIIKVITAEQ